MKFAIITDIHLGEEAYCRGILRKINQEAKIFLDDFIKKMNTDVLPEFVIVLGDLIEDDNKINDQNNIAYIVKLFKKLKCPAYYVAGNHDLINSSEEEVEKLFNYKKLYYSFDSGDYHFIVLFSKATVNREILISEEQKKWLQADLNKTNKKTIIFSHHSLADQDLTGNPWFEGRPEGCLVTNRQEIRNIFSSSKKVIAVFNSHLHWDKQDINDNIPYFTIQSLTENEDDKGIASEAHAVVSIVNNLVNVEIKGNYSKKFFHQS